MMEQARMNPCSTRRMMKEKVFNEVQRFSQAWIWVVLSVPGLAIIGLFALGVNRQIVHGQKFGNNPMSDQGLIVTFSVILLVLLLVALLLGFGRLTTSIDVDGIRFRFFPFALKFNLIRWEAIGKIEVISYNPIRDFGGWGIRGNKMRKAYTVSGGKALQVQLTNRKIILLGTQKEQELLEFLNNADFIPMHPGRVKATF